MNNKVTLIDFGSCNLLNVARAFEHCGADVSVIHDPAEVKLSERLVVPGVGAFANVMDAVTTRGFGDAICQYVGTGRPLFGICVGMQMLFDGSAEFGDHRGLGIIPGRVEAIPGLTTSGMLLRVPHIGWDQLGTPLNDRSWGGTLLEPFVAQRPAVYFVHSFAAQPEIDEDRLADCVYGGHRLCAAVQRGNVMATQFHPERSGEVGLKLVKHFLSL